jgi:hypothetical protein
MNSLQADPRFVELSPLAKRELFGYLEWLGAHGLSDNEVNFVYFATSRAGLKDGRELYEAWLMGFDRPPDKQSKLSALRFFLNPTEASFKHDYLSGWFEFIVAVCQNNEKPKMSKIKLPNPVFAKFGLK